MLAWLAFVGTWFFRSVLGLARAGGRAPPGHRGAALGHRAAELRGVPGGDRGERALERPAPDGAEGEETWDSDLPAQVDELPAFGCQQPKAS